MQMLTSQNQIILKLQNVINITDLLKNFKLKFYFYLICIKSFIRVNVFVAHWRPLWWINACILLPRTSLSGRRDNTIAIIKI